MRKKETEPCDSNPISSNESNLNSNNNSNTKMTTTTNNNKTKQTIATHDSTTQTTCKEDLLAMVSNTKYITLHRTAALFFVVMLSLAYRKYEICDSEADLIGFVILLRNNDLCSLIKRGAENKKDCKRFRLQCRIGDRRRNQRQWNGPESAEKMPLCEIFIRFNRNKNNG